MNGHSLIYFMTQKLCKNGQYPISELKREETELALSWQHGEPDLF
jgi:hypothetical protein